MSREIKLTGRRNLVTIVDDEDYERLSQRSWGIKACNGGFYAMASTDKNIVMHRELLGLTKGDGIIGDHRNGNTLDNRKCNLRRSTCSQNQRNGKLPKSNTTGHKGVFLDGKKYRSCIKINNKTRHLGSFTDAIAAAIAYDRAAIELHGEFARLNFPANSSG